MDGSVPSSPLGANATKDDELKYYKRQYELLEAELSEFQASSKDLEAELERDVEAAEKRERSLKQKVETLTYEVDEWKTKCKQAKTESSSAQTTLQKEITALRESNRTLQLRLRDIEVANDDYERQARHTTSSLEDMEIKYNSAIEKAVLLEAEMKAGEKEREDLRIEAQRVRAELADLHVEAEIQQTKLRRAEELAAKASKAAIVRARPGTPTSETIASSPTIATPQTGSLSSMTSDTQTPPSPITSDKAKLSPARVTGTSAASNGMQSIPYITRLNRSTTTVRPARPLSDEKRDPIATASSSLAQIRGLIGKMQKLEQKVQNVRAKMPATNTPPRAISKTGGTIGSSLINGTVPSSITVRSGRRGRTGGSILSGDTLSTGEESGTPSAAATPSGPPRHGVGIQGGIPVPTRLSTNNSDARSVTSSKSQPTAQFREPARPTSRISIHSHTSRQSLSHISSMNNINAYATMQPQTQRPQSRASITGPSLNGRTTPSLSRARSSIGGHNLSGMLPPAPLFSTSTSTNRPRRSSILPSSSNIFSPDSEDDTQTTPTQSSEYTSTKTAIPTPIPSRRKTGTRDSLVGVSAHPMPLFANGNGNGNANAKRKSGFGYVAAGTRKSGLFGANGSGKENGVLKSPSPTRVDDDDDGMGETY